MTFEVLLVAVLVGGLCLFSEIERRRPWQVPRPFQPARWTLNVSLFVLGWLLAGLVLPIAGEFGGRTGLVGDGKIDWAVLGGAPGVIAAFLIIDLASYGVHRAFHAFEPLWRIHAVHHSDLEVDTSTGVRHHPLETVLASLVLGGVAGLAAFPAGAVAAFALIRLAMQLFQHSNVQLPPDHERLLRFVICTPGHHRAHHSIIRAESDTNFGIVFSFWDRLFGTYLVHPHANAGSFEAGIVGATDPTWQKPTRVLLMPFILKRDASD
jgi:sterol desaturase/sphingolipid hydroxylase (fatty acid hydroxylase superfamily)